MWRVSIREKFISFFTLLFWFYTHQPCFQQQQVALFSQKKTLWKTNWKLTTCWCTYWFNERARSFHQKLVRTNNTELKWEYWTCIRWVTRNMPPNQRIILFCISKWLLSHTTMNYIHNTKHKSYVKIVLLAEQCDWIMFKMAIKGERLDISSVSLNFWRYFWLNTYN